jgi:hypothetical protein
MHVTFEQTLQVCIFKQVEVREETGIVKMQSFLACAEHNHQAFN